MVGRLVAEKGYIELIEAMRSVDAQLWVVGERLASDHADPVDAAVLAAATDPVLKQRVRFLGYRTDVPVLMRAADIYTLPSHREGMPRSVIEAMMSGLPVVGTDIRGTREEVVEGETGTLVPVGDAAALAVALSRLARDPALRAAWGAKGRARALALYREDLVIARQIEALALGKSAGS
jgi:glycosyltransferase involved in cell wall biosynthesis